jgi:hypothetical protein
MKKLSILLGVLLVLGMTVPAMAEVWVTGTVDKTKTITVDETVTIDKDVVINATVDVDLVKAAEADSVVNQDNLSNTVTGNPIEPAVDNNYKSAKTESSINDNTGIVGVNQDAGNMNNQANVVSVAVAIEPSNTDPASLLPSFANSQTSATQKNMNNSVHELENYLLGPQKEDSISDSINRNCGIVGVNQSVGSMNNQLNEVALAVADNCLVALAEADLGQYNANNTVFDLGTVRTDSIANSINGNTGIVGVNQSGGNMNNQSNMVSISATLP